MAIKAENQLRAYEYNYLVVRYKQVLHLTRESYFTLGRKSILVKNFPDEEFLNGMVSNLSLVHNYMV